MSTITYFACQMTPSSLGAGRVVFWPFYASTDYSIVADGAEDYWAWFTNPLITYTQYRIILSKKKQSFCIGHLTSQVGWQWCFCPLDSAIPVRCCSAYSLVFYPQISTWHSRSWHLHRQIITKVVLYSFQLPLIWRDCPSFGTKSLCLSVFLSYPSFWLDV